MFAQAVLDDCLIELPRILKGIKLIGSAPYRRVATAIKDDPREPSARGDIFAVGDKEYLVPEERRHDGQGKLVESIVRLDQASLIVNRPKGTRKIEEMELNNNVPDSVRAILSEAVKEFNPANFGYTVQIIRPQL